MEKLKGIGRIAIWLLGHLLMFSIYTVDRIISVFAPWQPMPKYLTWHDYFELDENERKTNPFLNRSVARVSIAAIFAFIGIFTPLWVWFIFASVISLVSFSVELSNSKSGL